MLETEGQVVSCTGKEQARLLNSAENNSDSLKDEGTMELIRILAHVPGARLLIKFDAASDISINSLYSLGTIVTDAMENGIETHFYNVPSFYVHFFPDIPEIKCISKRSCSGYQLVLAHIHSEFKLVSLNLKNTGKDVYNLA